ncbi:M23 family metallopeptidase [Acaryochloris sp. IP29b_bin.148]|uniref:M23 family metallopeptidase n=1 Tax=Acaryochloris sp. IP29b_bin.148 TaxID=2969218 RepID=UPI002623C33D|nr:M23 family metallopeptidase [Acaryochloris sp. IP29b_bin.148]
MYPVRIGKVLTQKGLINDFQLQQALQVQQQNGQKLGEILIQQGHVTRLQLQQALLEQRYRNWVACSLLTLSTVGPAFWITPPKSASLQNSETRENTLNSSQSAVGGTHPDRLRYAQPPTVQRPAFSEPFKRATTVAVNPHPTVASPLRGFCHPLKGKGYLSQGIRGRTHQNRMEYAYDLASPIGTPVYAMRSGRVIRLQDKYPDTGGSKASASKFNYVWIEHDNGYRSVYAHLQQGFRSQVQLKSGDWVKAGQLIGYSGNSGWSSGPHLHVEVQQKGSRARFSQTVPFQMSEACDAFARRAS